MSCKKARKLPVKKNTIAYCTEADLEVRQTTA